MIRPAKARRLGTKTGPKPSQPWELISELLRYFENGALSIDNNLSERSVRPVAIDR